MENNYFRITGYYPKEDFSFIVDSYGRFEKLWQFSVYMRDKGITVLAVSKDGYFLDGNMKRVEYDKEHILIRATKHGQPEFVPYEIDGIKYNAVKVDESIYIPNKESII